MSSPARAEAPSLVPRLRAALQQGGAQLEAAYRASANAAAMAHGRAALVDSVLIEIWRHYALPAPLALVAVGGYGRGELYPASDVDILLLLPDELHADHQVAIEQMVGVLWDIGLDVGHSVRNVAQCLLEADRDITVQTSLLEARLLAGCPETFAQFQETMSAHRDPQAFFKAKRLEQEERYARHNDTPYSLEPNCKESPGGFRDLQAILWISRAAGLGRSWRELAANGLLLPTEARQLERVETFLRHVRIRLHYLAHRREEKLMFDYQEALAQAFGITASATKRASELLMQRYYQNAKRITQLNTLLLQNLGERIFPAARTIPIAVSENFQMVRELLDVRDEQLFEQQPRAILESFLLLQQRPEVKGMTARTLRALWRARGRIDAAFRRDPDNRALFLSLFQQKRGLVHEFRRMNQYDILGHYLPAFGRIVGQMQHDLFHVYTVDQHILQVMRNVRRFTMPEFAHEYPLCSRLMAGFERHWPIYVAALFHDIAKGRGGDHSVLGEDEVRGFALQLGWPQEDIEDVCFLVREHLLLSQTAQRQDIGDPQVVARFAARVGSVTRLEMLYLLTVADIIGTSPSLWNGFKDRLLADLYHAARRVLSGDAADAAALAARCRARALALLTGHGHPAASVAALWQDFPEAAFVRQQPEQVAWQSAALLAAAATLPVVAAQANSVRGGLELFFLAADRDGLFATVTAALEREGYSVQEARILGTPSGRALDSFVLLDAHGGAGSAERAAHLCARLEAALRSARRPRAQRSLPRRLRHFQRAPHIRFEAADNPARTRLALRASDRPGLLADIAEAFLECAVRVHDARIATFGDRAEDYFELSDRSDRALDDAARARLAQTLEQRLGAPEPTAGIR